MLIWRDQWLPPSETFVLNQVDAMTRWRPRLGGLQVSDDRLLSRRHVSTLAKGGRSMRLARLGLRAPAMWPPLRRLFRGVDLSHSHFGPDATTIMDAADAFDVPRVITFHGYDATTRLDDRGDWPMTRRWDRLVGGAALLVAVSQFIADRLICLGAPQDRVRVVHTGIPIPLDAGPPPSQRPPSILFVGRLVEKKGLAVLLRSVQRLPRPLRSTPVTVIGDGPLRESLGRLAHDLGLTVDFQGARTPREVADAMRSHSLFVAPSLTAANGDAEGFGMVFLEAAAARLPVITSRSGGNVDAVAAGETGFVLDSGDTGALAETIAHVLRDSTLADRLGDAGRRRVVEGFDISHQTALLEQEYDRVVGDL